METDMEPDDLLNDLDEMWPEFARADGRRWSPGEIAGVMFAAAGEIRSLRKQITSENDMVGVTIYAVDSIPTLRDLRAYRVESMQVAELMRLNPSITLKFKNPDDADKFLVGWYGTKSLFTNEKAPE